MRLVALCLILLFVALAGCRGGGSSTPDPVVPTQINIEGIRSSHELAPGTPGYAGDELAIELLLSGDEPSSIVWDFGGGAIAFDLTDPTAPIVELGVPGTYTGSVQVIGSAGSQDEFTFTYEVWDESRRIRSISPNVPTGILDQIVRFSADVDGTTEEATWIFSGGTKPEVLHGESGRVRLTEVGLHEVELRITFANGPTVSRTFPIQVNPHSWSVVHDVTQEDVMETLVTSDGQIAILSKPSTYHRIEQLELFRVPIGQETMSSSWIHQSFGAAGVARDADLEEHQGRLGVLYTVWQTPYWSGPGTWYQRVYMSVTSNLTPVVASDWQTSPVGPYHTHEQIDLTGAEPSGWNALLYGNYTMRWATTMKHRPTYSDWVLGEMPDHPPDGLVFDLLLTTIDGALVCGIQNFESVEFLVAKPANFFQLQQALPYRMAGPQGFFSESDGRIFVLENLPDMPISVAMSPRTAPLQATDWQFQTVQQTDGLSGVRVTAVGDQGYALAFIDLRVGQDFESSLELWSGPLAEPIESWSRLWLLDGFGVPEIAAGGDLLLLGENVPWESPTGQIGTARRWKAGSLDFIGQE